MNFSRRFLPPIHILAAFEAAARLQGFSRAARELNLTQSAISKQIQALEDLLEVSLFERENRQVRLTEAGRIYADQIRASLKLISAASTQVRTNPGGGDFNLAILPTFGTRWLAPRLPDFLASAPGVTVSLTTRLEPFDFAAEPVDAAIHFGLPDWPDAECMFLMSETVIPACSRAFKARHRIAAAQDLLKQPLLHLESRPNAWKNWFADQALQYDGSGHMVFDQFAMAANACRSHLGVALLPTFLIEQELKDGSLTPALSLPPLRSEQAYYLVWPKGRTKRPPLEAFRAWLLRIRDNGDTTDTPPLSG